MLSLDDRALGWRLDLGDLADKPICHGYANACVCSSCVERENTPAPVRAKQPWDVAA